MKNRKMRLTMVRNTRDGIQKIGCRATGMYRGYYIERTAWCPIDQLNMDDTLGLLERYATGQYQEEIRQIDKCNPK